MVADCFGYLSTTWLIVSDREPVAFASTPTAFYNEQ